MERLFETFLKYRLLVIIALFALTGYGVYHYKELPTDAFPDISPIMVPVFAEAHGMAPEEVERLITFPIESAMNGLPGVTLVKSTSAFGMAVIYIYFRDDVDIYFARQIVSERLTNASSQMPNMDEPPTLGPISTGLGEVFMYYLKADENVDTEGKDKNTWLRELNDWVVKFQLQTVPGVTEILSMGGHVLQYQVKVDPYAMSKYGLSLEDVVDAVNSNNRNAGGQFLVLGAEEYLVRGIGLLEKKEQLGDIQLKVENGTPVRLKDVAEVDYGNEVRRGIVTLNGEEEVVAGIVIKLFGENTSKVIERLDVKFKEVAASLPKGVTIVPYYNQSTLVNNATGTVKKALLEGAFLVVIILLLFLGNLRAALIVTLALPVSVLVAAIGMGLTGLSANLMSLGGVAIAIGILGDGTIVVVENIIRRLGEAKTGIENKTEIIIRAIHEVSRPILASTAIIIVVFLPLFTLQGVEGKMFSPMAFTICFALLGSIVAALVFSPVLSFFLLKIEPEKPLRIVNFMKRHYQPMIEFALKHKSPFIASMAFIFVLTLALIPRLGTQFMPVLEEGVIQMNITMAPSISLDKSMETVLMMERNIKKYPAVEQTISKIGRPEAGSHPHPVNTAHIQIMLKPNDERGEYKTKDDIVQALNRDLSRYPGVALNFSQPIQNMFDELLSGVKTQLAIKLYGEDLGILRNKADEIKETIEGIPGLVDLSSEQSYGQPQVQIIADRDACAHYGVDVSDILEVVELAVGGEVVDQMYLNNRRFGINIRFKEEYRDDPEAIANLMVHSKKGVSVPLSQVAKVQKVLGPIQVNREKNQRRWTVSANVRGRDMGGVVADIQAAVKEKVKLPPGYYLEYGGQFENQQRAMKRLGIIVPTAFFIIFLFLYLSLGSWRSSFLIFTNVPLALIGGVFGLFIFGEYLSVPASVGFIALFGIAVQNGIIMVTYINQLREDGLPMHTAIVEGCLRRLRPVLMTALTTIAGLVPLLFATGMGSEVQRPLAIVVVFGLFSATFLTLFMIPILYGWFAPPVADEQSASQLLTSDKGE